MNATDGGVAQQAGRTNPIDLSAEEIRQAIQTKRLAAEQMRKRAAEMDGEADEMRAELAKVLTIELFKK